MKIKVQAVVNYPVTIDHVIDVQDPTDVTEVQEAIYALADNILNTSSIEANMSSFEITNV
jgi:hypothetical protein